MIIAHSNLMRITSKPFANELLKITLPNLRTLILIFVIGCILLRQSYAFSDVDNEIVGSPLVECERDRIRFSVPTKYAFRGKVYVKGEFTNEDCVREYADEGDDDNRNLNKFQSKSTRTDSLGSRKKQDNDDRGFVDKKRNETEDVIHPSVTIFDDRRRRGGKTRKSETAFNRERLASGQGGSDGRKDSDSNHWKNYLRGRSDSVGPNANGERPLVCPPCEKSPAVRHRRTATRMYDYADHRNEDDDEDEDGNTKSSHSAELEVLLGTCNTRRDRMANPPGVHVSFTVVVNFHNNFITKIDKAYHVECAYEESDRTVTTQIDVSAPQSIDLSGVMEPPQCHYRITPSSSEANNPFISNRTPLKNVHVGDSIRHEWICTRSSVPLTADNEKMGQSDERLAQIFGLLVHDCYVDDGQGRREPVIDDKGCSVSPLILPTPRYASDSMLASVDSLVAKFPDRDLLGFQCAITVCMREDNSCKGVTPPLCDQGSSANRVKRSAGNSTSVSEWQLNAPVLTVFDAIDDHADEFRSLTSLARRTAYDGENLPLNVIKPKSQKKFDEFCVSVTVFGVLVSAFTFIVTISTTIVFTVLFLHVQWHPSSQMT